MYHSQIETFVRVVEAGSFNKAAEESYITPPAVIKQINLLEKNLGVSLFIRTHRGLILTEAGKSFYKDAKYIIKYCEDAIQRAKNAAVSNENTIRVGISPMTPGQFLVDLLPWVQTKCPDIKFQFITFENTPENAREILKKLGENIDIVSGVFDSGFLEQRSCAALELSMEPIRIAVSIHHPLASKKFLTIQDLYDQNLMLIHRGWNSYVDLLRDDIFRNYPQIHVKDFNFYSVAVFNQCENSNDLLMTIDNWKDIHPLLKVIPVEWNHKIPFGLMHSPVPSPVVGRFLDVVRSAIS
jgi:DNA-binding transcriptional LysR family regulator